MRSQTKIFDQCSPTTDSSGNTLYVCSVNMTGVCQGRGWVAQRRLLGLALADLR